MTHHVVLDEKQEVVVHSSNMVSRFFWGWILKAVAGNWSWRRGGATAEKGVRVEDWGNSTLGWKMLGRRTLLENNNGANRAVVVAIFWNDEFLVVEEESKKVYEKIWWMSWDLRLETWDLRWTLGLCTHIYTQTLEFLKAPVLGIRWLYLKVPVT